MAEYVIETSNITKKYNNYSALQNINLTVKRGEIYGLIGDNGAGKTTFLKLLTGQIFKTAGELKLFGEHMDKALLNVRKRTGAIIETPGFYPQLSVEKNLEYYRIQKGIPGRENIDRVLQLVNLYDKKSVKCRNLSMGMKQRLGLGIALLGEPELLILDEPVNGLDPSGMIELRNIFLKLNREKNITIIISSHILTELEQIATVYGFLNKGVLIQQVTAAELHRLCENYIEITVSDAKQYTVLLETELKHESYRVLPDQTIQILNPQNDIQTYSQLAGANGLGVSKLGKRQISLEEYYMSLKDGGKSL